MANPQTENGHIRIAHDLYRAALKHLPPTDYKVWSAVADFTYGWGKKEAPISYSTLASACGLTVVTVKRSVKRLKAWSVLRVDRRDGGVSTIGINKDYDSWDTGNWVDTGNTRDLTPVSRMTPPPVHQRPDTGITDDLGHLISTHENHVRTKESHASSSSNDASDSDHLRHKLIMTYRDLFLNGGNIPTNQKQSTVRALVELQEMPEWNTEEAVTILRRLHKHEPARVAGKPFAYLAKPIADHLSNGTMPGTRAKSSESDERDRIEEELRQRLGDKPPWETDPTWVQRQFAKERANTGVAVDA